MNEENTIGNWIWLFPITYVCHVSEEYFGGPGYGKWLAQIGGNPMTEHQFLRLVSFGFVLISIGMILVKKKRSFRWIVITISTVFLINVLSHTTWTVLTRTYSPGLITAWLLWFPLGLFTFLRLSRSFVPKTLWLSVIVGAGIHAVVSILTILG